MAVSPNLPDAPSATPPGQTNTSYTTPITRGGISRKRTGCCWVCVTCQARSDEVLARIPQPPIFHLMSKQQRKFFPATQLALLTAGVCLLTWFFMSVINPVREPYTSPANACINSLRQVDGAKNLWAREHFKNTNDVPTSAEIAVYLRNGQFPLCPKGGTYTIGQVGTLPTCSIPGHVMPP